MASKETYIRLNPEHTGRLDKHVYGKGVDDFITHTPRTVSATQAKKLLESIHRGKPLAVEVSKTEGEKHAEAAQSEVEEAKAEAADDAAEAEAN